MFPSTGSPAPTEQRSHQRVCLQPCRSTTPSLRLKPRLLQCTSSHILSASLFHESSDYSEIRLRFHSAVYLTDLPFDLLLSMIRRLIGGVRPLVNSDRNDRTRRTPRSDNGRSIAHVKSSHSCLDHALEICGEQTTDRGVLPGPPALLPWTQRIKTQR